ncbi:hypothetical protein SCOR_15185 [Sulfidibacter corallicola]|uniref:Uncharacterized protein n=1 Tax=Sulfidibacter corallicola TaxID=2818388 RepID=A0A8A4TY93_SULCO|nr:hypothetical protein [Sulfidibacter corallicola]QTD54188.1 hypothetical protein J3U87_17215 [Sulfidibacter corallicola]
MTVLTEVEKASVARDVRDLIEGSGQRATLLRVTGAKLYGSDDQATEPIGEIPIELVETPSVNLSDNVDATGHVLPEADVRPTDRIRLAGATYRVQTVKPQNLFGVITHQVVTLIHLR